MAKKTNKKLGVKHSEISTIGDAIEAGVKKMWEDHGIQALEVVNGSDKKKGVVNFAVSIDASTSDTSIDVRYRSTETVTDHVHFTVTDPRQGKFEVLIGAGAVEQDKEEKEEEEDE